MGATQAFLEARDQLLRCRDDLAEALRAFRWPALTEFNWARDYFDVIASGNEAAALRVVDDAGGDETLSFARLARRSAQVAAFLEDAGVEPGDRILIMLPNCTALWETMLAAIRLGAVIIPALKDGAGSVADQLLCTALGLEPDGAVRAGLVHYNDAADVDRLLEGLADLAR